MPYFTTPLGLKCEAFPAASQRKTSLSMGSACGSSTGPAGIVKVRLLEYKAKQGYIMLFMGKC